MVRAVHRVQQVSPVQPDLPARAVLLERPVLPVLRVPVVPPARLVPLDRKEPREPRVQVDRKVRAGRVAQQVTQGRVVPRVQRERQGQVDPQGQRVPLGRRDLEARVLHG